MKPYILTILLILFLLISTICGCELARADEIDDNLISAIIQVESNGNPNAVSPKGAIGLMQITPIVLEEFNNWSWKIVDSQGKNPLPAGEPPNYNIGDLYNPKINVEIGTWYLRRLKDHYLKDKYTIERLLCAWNGGITKLRKYDYDCSKMPRESREFTKKVLKIYKGAK